MPLRAKLAEGAALTKTPDALIAIDGKTSRRTGDKRKGLKALHTLSAPEKTNHPRTVIRGPELLAHLAEPRRLEGALVTIDAMGMQVEIVAHGPMFSWLCKATIRSPYARSPPILPPRRPTSSSPRRRSRRGTAASRRASTRPRKMSPGSRPVVPIPVSPASRASPRSCGFKTGPNMPVDAPSTRGSTSPPRRLALGLVRANKAEGSVRTRRKSAGWNKDFLLGILQLE